MRLILASCVIALAGCSSVNSLLNTTAITDCFDVTTGTITVTNATGVVIAKPAETIHFCPPSVKVVPQGA